MVDQAQDVAAQLQQIVAQVAKVLQEQVATKTQIEALQRRDQDQPQPRDQGPPQGEYANPNPREQREEMRVYEQFNVQFMSMFVDIGHWEGIVVQVETFLQLNLLYIPRSGSDHGRELKARTVISSRNAPHH
ncbi:unnamed protein product [Linum trigynum]|uniref:Uncharacterized protein n=1 Tax=Linum trigynum TaxID=586398 RepID=A0AAV2ETD0_9ROSI